MSGSPRVLLVRHGQSTWNADGRWQGQADPPLSRLGEIQAVAAAASPELRVVEKAWSSDLQRARRTAELVSGARITVRLDPRLRERHAGEWEGLTRAQIDTGWPGFLRGGKRPDGWEDDRSVLVRALAAVVDIGAGADAGGDTGAIAVTHGGVIRAIERDLGAEALPVPNLGGRWIVLGADGPRLGARVLLVDVADVTVPGQI